MIRKIMRRFLFPSVDIATCPNDAITRFIKESQDAQAALRNFIGDNEVGSKFISLGEICSSAWYLKQVGLKNASFPFDWIFSSPKIVLDCVNDGFKKYLDKSLIKPKINNVSAGHEYYHSNFFNHRSPLRSEEDYNYYKRCCQRFIHNLKAQEPTYYLITLINEPSKRPGWANGFSHNFSMPVNQDYKTIVDLVETLKNRTANCKFIVIDHYTNSNRHATSQHIDVDVMLIKFSAGGNSTGVFYQDHLDDFCFKLIMTGLHGLHNNGMLVPSEARVVGIPSKGG